MVVVSLADPQGAQVWLSQMDCDFDFLLDRKRNVSNYNYEIHVF